MMRCEAQILVSMCGFSVDFDRDSAILISLHECVEEGMVEFSSFSMVNFVFGCRLLMC